MKKFFAIVATLAVMSVAQTSNAMSVPNRAKTPGAVFPTCTAAMVCKPGYSGRVRNVDQASKERVCRAYGITKGCPGPGYEIDHLVSLELCGSNDEKNLWPQPHDEAVLKDALENELHRHVCASPDLLHAAQAKVAAWGRTP